MKGSARARLLPDKLTMLAVEELGGRVCEDFDADGLELDGGSGRVRHNAPGSTFGFRFDPG
jgi:hypothetical protein